MLEALGSSSELQENIKITEQVSRQANTQMAGHTGEIVFLLILSRQPYYSIVHSTCQLSSMLGNQYFETNRI
jgi:hypothetical protein